MRISRGLLSGLFAAAASLADPGSTPAPAARAKTPTLPVAKSSRPAAGTGRLPAVARIEHARRP
jgi:hypothetical protein